MEMMRMPACAPRKTARQAPRGGSFPSFAEPEERHASRAVSDFDVVRDDEAGAGTGVSCEVDRFAERTWPITSDCLR